MKEKCKHCKTWEEDMYWKHFNTFHFFRTLPQDFHDHLVLPKKFASHMKARLPNIVSVIGPSGSSWQIELQKSDDLVFVGNEWKDFVKAHDLKENCLLMFKYDKNLGFKVLIFDKGSSCEMEAAYFIKRCSRTKSLLEDHRKTAREVSSTEIIENDYEEEESVIFVSEKHREDDGPEACSGGKLSTETSRKCALSTAARVRGLSRRVSLPCKSLSKPKVQPRKKSIANETAKAATHPNELPIAFTYTRKPRLGSREQKCLWSFSHRNHK